MTRRPAIVVVLIAIAVPARADDTLPSNTEDRPCPGFGVGPDLAKCSVLAGAGKWGRLKAIACVVEAINEWQHDQLRCLEEQVQTRASKVIYPVKQVIGQVNMTLGDVNTLREEVERMACGWRFSPRARLLEGVYLRKVKLCRPSFERIFGRHDGYWTAPFHELTAWSSVTTKNLIAERTGLELDQGAEATWMYTATSIAGGHIEDMRSPAQALRLASTSAADGLRARNSTLQMQAQRLLVGEQLRAWRASQRTHTDALAWQLTASVASWDRPSVPLGEEIPR